MEICHHLIKKEHIVGIGPLSKTYSSDHQMHELYQPVLMFFLVHLKTISIKIESGWFYRTGVDATLFEEHKNLAADFKKGYEEARKTIKEMIE
jgi:hypothetical protein